MLRMEASDVNSFAFIGWSKGGVAERFEPFPRAPSEGSRRWLPDPRNEPPDVRCLCRLTARSEPKTRQQEAPERNRTKDTPFAAPATERDSEQDEGERKG